MGLEQAYLSISLGILVIAALECVIAMIAGRRFLPVLLVLVPLPAGWLLTREGDQIMSLVLTWYLSVLVVAGFAGLRLARRRAWRAFWWLAAVLAGLAGFGMAMAEFRPSGGFMPNFGWQLGALAIWAPALAGLLAGALIGRRQIRRPQ